MVSVTRESALAYLEAECARQSLADYSALVYKGWRDTDHGALLIEHLEALERRDLTRLIVEMPPRAGKSVIVSRLMPSWYLGRHPDHDVILASYGDSLAVSHGRAVRDLVQSDRYPFAAGLRPDVKAAGQWQTTEGGGLIGVGVGSGITGRGGNLIIVDDAVKDRQDAESEVIRDRTWDWWQDVLLTRLMDDGVIVVMMTRWHEDDLVGRILNSAGASDWTRLRIPYLAEPGDPLNRAVGERLEVFGTVPSVEKGEISSYGFSALYQQNPTPAGGGVFKREWMQRRYRAEDLVAERPRWSVIQVADLGGKQGVGHDPSAIATWGTDGISYFLLDYWSSQAEYADIKTKFAEKWFEWHPRMLFVEDATWAQPLISDLRRATGVNVTAVPAIGSKWTRADAISPLFESGRVVLPERAPWLDGWMSEHLQFPNGIHDEAVDTTSMALSRLSAQNASARVGLQFDMGKPAQTRADAYLERRSLNHITPRTQPNQWGKLPRGPR